MRKSRLTIAALVLAPTLVPAPVLAAKPEVPTIAGTLLSRMNSGPDRRITRRVVCTPTTQGASLTFACELESVRSTRLRVDVTVTPGGVRETWYPLEG